FQSVLGQPSMRLLRRCVGRTSHGHLLGKLRELAVRAANLSGRRFVFVESAHELSDDQKMRLEKILETKLASPVSATYTLRPDLLGGLVIRMGTERVDASLATRVGALKRSIVG
ncbi:MAG: F0F1 ATP synthase subunit delta, partial [Trueperella pyogenes]|nr:F0F1 ATP synthase subunit delta [Trueperella pyogenes]